MGRIWCYFGFPGFVWSAVEIVRFPWMVIFLVAGLIWFCIGGSNSSVLRSHPSVSQIGLVKEKCYWMVKQGKVIAHYWHHCHQQGRQLLASLSIIHSPGKTTVSVIVLGWFLCSFLWVVSSMGTQWHVDDSLSWVEESIRSKSWLFLDLAHLCQCLKEPGCSSNGVSA
jgi:hypothetical protein